MITILARIVVLTAMLSDALSTGIIANIGQNIVPRRDRGSIPRLKNSARTPISRIVSNAALIEQPCARLGFSMPCSSP